MSRKPKPKLDDPAEYKRFLETAEAVEASEEPEAFDLAFKKIVPLKRAARRSRGDA